MKRKDIEKQLAEWPNTVWESSGRYPERFVATGPYVEEYHRYSYTTTKGFPTVGIDLVRDGGTDEVTGAKRGRWHRTRPMGQFSRVIANSLEEYLPLVIEEEARQRKAREDREAALARTRSLTDEFRRLLAEAGLNPGHVGIERGYAKLSLSDEVLGQLNGYIDAALSITAH